MSDNTPIEQQEHYVSSKDEQDQRVSFFQAMIDEISILDEDYDEFIERHGGKHQVGSKELPFEDAIRKIANEQIRRSMKRVLQRWTEKAEFKYNNKKMTFNMVKK